MNIGLVDVDSHNFPNFALMKISAYHKANGDNVEMADENKEYDKVYQSKIFTFTPDIDIWKDKEVELITGGTGYSVSSKLPKEIDEFNSMDYSIYPDFPFSIQFFSRGCIRSCPFCLVKEKEGDIHPVTPVQMNPNGEWIEVLDNNFFANPEWKEAVTFLIDNKQPVNLHGVDVRIMNEEQAYWLNKLKLKKNIHIAWDLPQVDLTNKLKEVLKYIKPYKLMCYVLVGFNSTMEQDLYRIETLKSLNIRPFVMPYKDFENERTPSQYEKDLARWVNNKWIFNSCEFKDFKPRKDFCCDIYYKVEDPKTVTKKLKK